MDSMMVFKTIQLESVYENYGSKNVNCVMWKYYRLNG